MKIISSVIGMNQGTGLFKTLFREIVKINDEGLQTQDIAGMRGIDCKVSLKMRKSMDENSRTFGLSALSVPKLSSEE